MEGDESIQFIGLTKTQSVLENDTSYLYGAIGPSMGLGRFSFPETRNWSNEASWADDPGEIDVFAIIYHNISLLRVHFPWLYLLVAKIPRRLKGSPQAIHRELERDILRSYDHVALDINLHPDKDVRFVHLPGAENWLFEIGKKDFLDFAGHMFSDKWDFRVLLLFSHVKASIEETRKWMGSCTSAKEFEGALLDHFDPVVCFDWESGFSIITRNSRVAEAHRRLPRIELLETDSESGMSYRLVYDR